MSERGITAVIGDILVVNSTASTVYSTIFLASEPLSIIRSPVIVPPDFGTAAFARSYAVFTEFGVAAVVVDVLLVESVSFTTPS